MDGSLFAAVALRGVVVLGATMVAVRVLRSAPSSTRRLVLAVGLVGALASPLASSVVPRLEVTAPSAAITVLRTRIVADSLPVGAAALAAPAASSSLPPASSRPLPWRTILFAVWSLGAALVLARLGVGISRARAIVRGSRRVTSPEWRVALARASRAMGVTADLRETDALDAPAVTGVLSPTVLVPTHAGAWDEERRVAVLLHELAHVRQRDCLAHVASQLACALHWFDPLVWWAAARLRVERELAADDAVIAAGACASSYAESLLAISGARPDVRPVPVGALGIADGRELSARIVAIVSASRPRARLSPITTAGVVVAASALVLVVACAAPSVTDPTSGPAASVAGSGRTTIDRRVQGIADDELARAIAESGARGGAVVVLDPSTGEIVAEAGNADTAVMPGSTFKAVTFAAALDEGRVTLADAFDCRDRAFDDRVLYDGRPHGTLPLTQVFATSSNVGTSRVLDRLGADRLLPWMTRFHFDASRARSVDAFSLATTSIGVSVTATPVQIAAAYAVFANGGDFIAPTRASGPASRERIVSPETARTMLVLMGEVVNGEQGTGRLARIPGVAVAGKTGTADWEEGSTTRRWASFVGVAPADHPRFVVLVGLDTPAGEDASGGSVAAPAFARIVTRALSGG